MASIKHQAKPISATSNSDMDATRVETCYRDYFGIDISAIKQEIDIPKGKRKGPRGGVVVPFPVKLYAMLEGTQKEGLEHIVSWQPHGRCFMVHEPTEFVADILPRYFRQSKLTSFQRQLNLYGFQRLVNGPDRGGYYHELFLNGRPDICKIILRTRVKGSCMKPAPLHSQEPDLYSFQRCSAEKATTTAVVVDSSDEMSDKQQSDDSSTHSSASASTLGPQPTGTPKEIQTPLEGTISDDEKFPPFTTSMSLHIVSDEQNSAAATDVLVLDPLAPSSWDSPIESAPLTTSAPIPLAVTSQFPSLSAEFPFSLPSWQTAEEIRPLLPNVVGCEDQFRRRVSCDEQGVFEGRSFQCIDEATLRNMEAILISEG